MSPLDQSANSENNPSLPTGAHGAEAVVHRQTKKEFVLHEAREVFFMVSYLAISLSLIATFRSLVLIQNGINDFTHSYIVAIVLAVALGKIVVLGQKLPFVSAFNHRPLIYSVLYKAALMTLLANLGGKLEEKLFPALNHGGGSTAHQLVLLVTHQLALMSIFIVLFTWRDLERVLGHGTLFRLFFLAREPAPTPKTLVSPK